MKKWLAIGIVAILGVAGFFVFQKTKTKSVATTQPVTTIQPTVGPFRAVISSTGEVVAAQEVAVKCKASGTVIKLPYDVSDEVKAGQVLLQLDTLDQERTVKKAKAMVDADKASLAQARQDYDVAVLTIKTNKMKAEAALATAIATAKESRAKFERQAALLKEKLASQEEYDAAEKTAAVADADVLTAQAGVEDIKTQEASLESNRQTIKQKEAVLAQDQYNLELQQQQLDYATVTAPFDGVVTSLSSTDSNSNTTTIRIGSMVQSGTSSVSGGTTVMMFSDLSKIYVDADVDESDIGRVIDPQTQPDKKGQHVKITADAYPNVEFDGRVVRVDVKGTKSSNVVTFTVRIEVTSDNRRMLRPRMTTNNDIILASNRHAITVPLNAVGYDGPQAYVYLAKDDGGKERKEITVGQNDGYSIEVTGGLEGSENLVPIRSGSDSKFRNSGDKKNSSRPMMMPR